MKSFLESSEVVRVFYPVRKEYHKISLRARVDLVGGLNNIHKTISSRLSCLKQEVVLQEHLRAPSLSVTSSVKEGGSDLGRVY